ALPALAGASAWGGCYSAVPLAASAADGSMPLEPVSIAASCERMSPNRFPVTMTSHCLGLRTSCMAQLSTYMWDSSMSAWLLDSSMTTSRHSCEVSSTLALSTEQTRFLRLRAASNATFAIRRTSHSL